MITPYSGQRYLPSDHVDKYIVAIAAQEVGGPADEDILAICDTRAEATETACHAAEMGHDGADEYGVDVWCQLPPSYTYGLQPVSYHRWGLDRCTCGQEVA